MWLYRHQTLHRNFQGYCPRRITAQVYAFGVSGISQLDEAYAQNTKDISAYISQVNANQLPIAKGYALASWQRINTRSNRMYYVQQLCELERYG